VCSCSVEKGRYKSLEEGIGVCVDIFLTAMKELVKKRKFKLYIHPIVPVRPLMGGVLDPQL
jgi:hypothetical protein